MKTQYCHQVEKFYNGVVMLPIGCGLVEEDVMFYVIKNGFQTTANLTAVRCS